MVTCQQVRRLFKLVQTEKNFGIAALRAGMDEKTARKYRRLGKLPGELNIERTWRTRKDPFDDVWPEIQFKLESNPGFEAKTLFEDLQRGVNRGSCKTFTTLNSCHRGIAGPPDRSWGKARAMRLQDRLTLIPFLPATDVCERHSKE